MHRVECQLEVRNEVLNDLQLDDGMNLFCSIKDECFSPPLAPSFVGFSFLILWIEFFFFFFPQLKPSFS